MSQAVPRHSPRPVRALIEAKLADGSAIRELRDEIHRKTGAGSDYWKLDPHLTILPPFTIDKRHLQQVDKLIEESNLLNQSIPINGMGVWPSIKNPRVVLLDTPVNLETERQNIITELESIGAVEMEEPVCPHITLFKTDNGYDVPEMVKEHIQQAVGDHRESWETEIEYVDMNVVAHLTTNADE